MKLGSSLGLKLGAELGTPLGERLEMEFGTALDERLGRELGAKMLLGCFCGEFVSFIIGSDSIE